MRKPGKSTGYENTAVKLEENVIKKCVITKQGIVQFDQVRQILTFLHAFLLECSRFSIGAHLQRNPKHAKVLLIKKIKTSK